MSDKSGKTEEPTQRRVEKARKEGQFPAAKEFVSGLQFLVFLSLLSWGGAAWFRQFELTTRSLFIRAFAAELKVEDLSHIAWQLFWSHFLPLVAAGMAVVAASVAFRLVTTSFGISFKKLMPDAQRFSPLSKLQELPKQSLPALMQALLLLPVFLWAVYAVVLEKLDTFMALPLQSVESGAAFFMASLMELFWKASIVFLLFGSVDLFRQLRRYKRDLRMSKQEI